MTAREQALQDALWKVVKAVHRYGHRNAPLTTVVDRIAGETLVPGAPKPNPRIPEADLWMERDVEGKSPTVSCTCGGLVR